MPKLFVHRLLIVSHLITTSRNLFQSAGLNRLRHIARPLISFMTLLFIYYSTSCFFSLSKRGTSRRHFSIRLQQSKLFPILYRPSSQKALRFCSCCPCKLFLSNISGLKKEQMSLSSPSRLLRIRSDGMMKNISASLLSSCSENDLCFSPVASITEEK